MARQDLIQPPRPGETRFISGSTGQVRPPHTANKERKTIMARLEGTGKDPLGRYGKGEVFDVPKFVSADPLGDAERDDLTINPVYQDLLDKGYAKELAAEDDPARTPTAIADHVVATGGALPDHPADRAVAEKVKDDAYAITHTGDPNATADGDLKTDAIREGQVVDERLQRSPSARFLGDDKLPEAAQEARSRGGDSEGSGSSRRSGAASGGSGGSSS